MVDILTSVEKMHNDSYEVLVASPRRDSRVKLRKKRPSIIQRPQTMMLNRPAQYPVGNPPNYTGSNPARPRPISAIFNHSQPSLTMLDPAQSNVKRGSFHEEEDGTPPSTSYFASIKDRLSGSYESLDEATLDTTDLESDPDLSIKTDEPEAWSVTVDKKTLKKLSLSKKDVKRQENIFEFIQTERNYLTTLKIMQKIFGRGLTRELHMDQTTINKLFPLIDDHVDFVSQFVHKLIERQNASKVVPGIGDILVTQWENESGSNMKRLFGDFCSKQNEITSFYKDLMKSDKKFQAFMRKCEKNPLTRRQGFNECALLMTQRITKYPIMLQTMLDNSNKKDHKEDLENLERSLALSREIAKDVDEQVQAHEREQLLLEIYDKTESKSSSSKDGRRFDRKDFIKRNRKLLYSNTLQWMKENKKFTEIFFLLLSDCIVFLQENNGKYTFPSQQAVVPLQKMIVREVASDEKSLYLMSMSSQQMYTLKVQSVDDCKTLTHIIRLAVGNCPEEEEKVTSEDESERRNQEQRLDKAKQMITQLEMTDQRINRLLKEKMVLFQRIAESVDRGNAVEEKHFTYTHYASVSEEASLPVGTPILAKAVEQVTKLAHIFYGPGGLSRHSSSAGEHESSSRAPPILPKRSDTFGGFDNDKEPSSPRAKYLNSSQSDSKLAELEQARMTSESSNRDSGLIDPESLDQHSESQSSIQKAWEPSTETSSGVTSPEDSGSYIPPTCDQITALTTLAHLLSDYQSFAAQQDTHMEKLLIASLSQDRFASKKKSFGGNLQEAEYKRNRIKQQEQMDDIRKQEAQLRTEKDQWHKQQERFQRSMEAERRELEAEKERIERERVANEREKQDIQKSKDDYQRELSRLREMQRKIQHDSSSITQHPAPNRNSNNNIHLLDTTDSRSDRTSISSSKSHSSLHSNFHSNLHSGNPESSKAPPSPTYASAAEYPRTFPGPRPRDSSVSQVAPPAHQLPIHLQYSATNQLSALQVPKHQDINPKLSKLASNSKHPSKQEKHQLLPGKLSSKLGNLSQAHNSSTSLDNLRNLASFGQLRRKHANTEPIISHHLQVPPTKQSDWLSPTNSVSPTPLSGSSIERTSSASSASSRDADKRSRMNGGEILNEFKSKREETVELFL